MTSVSDTIVAVATPPGVGAVSVIRISGQDALLVIERCFSRPEKLRAALRYAVLGTIFSKDGSVIDEVLAISFHAPASYTGECVVEISGHGGIHVTRAVLDRIIQCGARPAEAGEFTQRAFLNGKMDLTQAEGVMDIISAQSDLALKAAQNQLNGGILKAVNEIRDDLIEVTAHLEAFIDFPEDDIDPESGELLTKRLSQIIAQCESLLSTSETGRLLREGARVVICGEPNAGKSSLLNRLLGYERAIVSEVKGTTRDTVEEVVNFGGVPVRLIDTAGLRESTEIIEGEGIERAKSQIAAADVVIQLVDGSLSRDQWVPAVIPEEITQCIVLNKSDRAIHQSWLESNSIALSCETGEGVGELKAKISALLLDGRTLSGSAFVAINARHQSCLNKIMSASLEASENIARNQDSEIIALVLRDALSAVGELTGRVDVEEILDIVFRQFCIGK